MLCRDDEHRTGLMLAAEEGHIPVMKILLDNHAVVNDRDKMKVRLTGTSVFSDCICTVLLNFFFCHYLWLTLLNIRHVWNIVYSSHNSAVVYVLTENINCECECI